jgi:hypothetical protein
LYHVSVTKSYLGIGGQNDGQDDDNLQRCDPV